MIGIYFIIGQVINSRKTKFYSYATSKMWEKFVKLIGAYRQNMGNKM